MKKKVKFSIKMRQDVEVRNLEELRQNFSLTRVLVYMSNGKLVKWLRNGYMNDIADKIEALDENDSEIERKIFEIFHIKQDEENIIDIEKFEQKEERLNKLKTYTELWHEIDIDNVAFTQSEMYDLLDEKKTIIYLCGDKFDIPVIIKGINYIGINNPIVIINSKEIINKEDISFSCVRYDDEYQKIIDRQNQISKTMLNTMRKGMKVLFYPFTVMIDGMGQIFDRNFETISQRIENNIKFREMISNINNSVRDQTTILRGQLFTIKEQRIYKNPSMLLIYNYDELSVYGKIILDESSLDLGKWDNIYGINDNLKDLEIRKKASREFIEFCKMQNNKKDSYNFIFWAVMTLNTVEDDKERYISLIYDFAENLDIKEDEMKDIFYIVQNIGNKEINQTFKTESIPCHFGKLLKLYE